MTGPLNITAESLALEADQFQRKLGAGLGTLREMDDVQFGVTPREEVWRDGKVVLYRFKGERTPTAKVPMLVCYALVNRPYMVDLQADRSLVKGLLERGEDVYIIDWGYPDRSDRYLTLEDYIERFLGGAVDHLRKAHGLPSVNLLGICQGGVFSLCYSALHPRKVRNLITMVTPVDFHTADNMLSNWNREIDVDLLVDTLGNIPADMMNLTYLMLKPWRLFAQKYVGMVDILDDRKAMEDFLRMEKWIFDSPDQAGEAFREFNTQFFQENRFVKGGAQVGGREVHLGLSRCRSSTSSPNRTTWCRRMPRARSGTWPGRATTPSCRSRAAISASTSPVVRRRKCRRPSTSGWPSARVERHGRHAAVAAALPAGAGRDVDIAEHGARAVGRCCIARPRRALALARPGSRPGVPSRALGQGRGADAGQRDPAHRRYPRFAVPDLCAPGRAGQGSANPHRRPRTRACVPIHGAGPAVPAAVPGVRRGERAQPLRARRRSLRPERSRLVAVPTNGILNGERLADS
jgi:polyhydroxyalkanoate synthase